ncbi:MAG TPA: sigma-70 family RNA polymerase sigma factor [Nocardioidaceae bacterium]|nr:sigma-70 family RNA polymerase sigma factor [Nocardioidaceae bacterium]
MVPGSERRHAGASDGQAGDLTEVHAALDGALREHWARLLALLIRDYASVDVAEDSLQDAYAAAAEHWTRTVPDNPAAWLLTTARRKATDRLRREATLARKLPMLVVDDVATGPDVDLDAIPDERLRLICTCCHPALSHEASVALTLRLVAGLHTREIARLFLVSEATMAARLTRAKRKIAASAIPFRVPERTELPARLARVCHVAYLLFTEGYAATTGPDLMRVELCDEAIRLQCVVVELAPDHADAIGLLALMRLQHARRDARVDAGALVPLGDQDRTRWHRAEIDQGRSLLRRAADIGPPVGPYTLQAAIAAEHMVAPTADATDWAAIARLYDQLERLTESPVVRLNRAVAVAEAEGAAAGLALLDGLDERLPQHHRLPATRAELLRRIGDRVGAVAEYDRAIERVGTGTERAYLVARRDELTSGD